MNRIIFLTLVLVLAMVGCDLFEKDDTPTTTHPNPTAVIGFSPNSPIVTQTVTLDATGSKTSYGVICVVSPPNLTFLWTLAVPTGSTATLSSATVAKPTFTPDIAGDYQVGLTVTDPQTVKTSSQVTQTITATAIPDPTAVITASSTGTIGTQVSLSGTDSTTSYDAAYIASPANLTFAWSLSRPTNSLAVLSLTTSAQPTFTPDIGGTYTVTLAVTDVDTSKVSSQVQHVVTVPIPDPTAVISAPTSGTVGMQVSLSGTSSTTSYSAAYTASPANLTFAWSLSGPTGSTAQLSSATSGQPTFTPDLEGTYTVSLTVTDVSTSKTDQAPQEQITVVMPRLTVGATTTQASKRVVLTSGMALFPVTLSANSAENLTVTGLTVRSNNDAAVYQVDLYGGTSSTLVTTYHSTAYANSGIIMFTGLTISVPASGSYYLGIRVTVISGIAGQSLTLTIDATQDIVVSGVVSSTTLHNTTNATTDQIIGPAGAGVTSDSMSWEEWVFRDSLIQATMPNEASGSRSAPNGAVETVARFTLTPYGNATPYVIGIFLKVTGKAQAGTFSAYQGANLLGQSSVYHDSRKRLMWQDVPDNFANGTETLHWIPFTNGLSLTSATVIEIKANVYTVGGSTTSWSLTVSLCLDNFIWYDNGDPVGNPNSVRTAYLDATSGAALSPSASLSFAGGSTPMTDPGRATMAGAQAILVQSANSKIIIIWNRPVWDTQGYGWGYFRIWDATPSSTTDIGEVFATVAAPTVIPRNWVTVTHNNAHVMIQTQVDLVTNPPSPPTGITIVGADGTAAIDHSLTSAIVDCRR